MRAPSSSRSRRIHRPSGAVRSRERPAPGHRSSSLAAGEAVNTGTDDGVIGHGVLQEPLAETIPLARVNT